MQDVLCVIPLLCKYFVKKCTNFWLFWVTFATYIMYPQCPDRIFTELSHSIGRKERGGGIREAKKEQVESKGLIWFDPKSIWCEKKEKWMGSWPKAKHLRSFYSLSHNFHGCKFMRRRMMAEKTNFQWCFINYWIRTSSSQHPIESPLLANMSLPREKFPI